LTLREVLAALWRRKWIIVAVTFLAALVAGVYLTQVDPNYKSSTTARAGSFLVDSIAAGAIAGIPADVDPSVITTPAILEPAADALGEDVQDVASNVTYEVIEGLRTDTLVVTATGPTSEAAQARAQAVMQSYSDYLNNVIATTLATLQSNVATTTDQIRAYQAQLASNPDDAIAAQNLATALSTLSGYNAQIVVLQNAGSVLTVTSAAYPGTSTNPSLLIVAGLALVCGLIAGAGIALIRDFFDDRIRAADEVEPLTGVPTIAELANDRRVARKKVRLPAGSAERTALSEGIRSLRTTIQVMLPDGKGAIVISSVEPGDGKTFLSANLAVSWARAGRKVVLVGGDLRRGQLGSYFHGLNDVAGLGDLLSDAAAARRAPTQVQVIDTLQSTSYRGLRIMPSGATKDEPADLLGGRHLGRVISQLARNADVVVIDSPPALALADASELASHSIGVILVATVNRTRRALLRDTVSNLRANGIDVLGIIVNRSQRRLPRSYSSYYVERSARRPPVARQTPQPTAQPLEDDRALLAVDEGVDNAAPSAARPLPDTGSVDDRFASYPADGLDDLDDDDVEPRDEQAYGDELEDADEFDLGGDLVEDQDFHPIDDADAAGEAGAGADHEELADDVFDTGEPRNASGGLRRDVRRGPDGSDLGLDQDQTV